MTWPLSGACPASPTRYELARFPDPLSPRRPRRAAGRPPLDLAAAAVYRRSRPRRDLILVEGAGGLLVRYDPAGATIADLAAMLSAPVLVVTTARARHPEPHRAHP